MPQTHKFCMVGALCGNVTSNWRFLADYYRVSCMFFMRCCYKFVSGHPGTALCVSEQKFGKAWVLTHISKNSVLKFGKAWVLTHISKKSFLRLKRTTAVMAPADVMLLFTIILQILCHFARTCGLTWILILLT
jgi:hypothetical protein